MADIEQPNVMSLTVTLLSAYFANNTVPSTELPALVDGTRKALLGEMLSSTTAATSVDASDAPAPAPAAAPESAPASVAPAEPVYAPAITVEESLASPDAIRSMIDGKPYKALKRHLSTHGLTPAEYRARYNLPTDYPMVAPSYSEARRAVAKRLGLGSRRPAAGKAAETPSTPDATSAEVEAPATAKPKRAAGKTKETAAPAVPPKPARRARTKTGKVDKAPQTKATTKPRRARVKPEVEVSPSPAADETPTN